MSFDTKNTLKISGLMAAIAIMLSGCIIVVDEDGDDDDDYSSTRTEQAETVKAG